MKQQKPNINITDRDLEIFHILQHLPLTTHQLLGYSRVFDQPFSSERATYYRLGKLEAAGWLRRHYFAFPSASRNPSYWRLAPCAFQMLCHALGTDPSRVKRSRFRAIGVSLHFHTYRLNELLVHLLVAARQNDIQIASFEVEKPVRLSEMMDDKSLVPDATLTLLAADNKEYRFFVELDTASERIATRQRLPSSIQKKLEFYQRLRRRSGQSFRVLFVTTSSRVRADHILEFSQQMSDNLNARQVYAAFLPDILKQDNCFHQTVFQDHQKKPVCLMPTQKRGVMAQLNQKEFSPAWLSPTVS